MKKLRILSCILLVVVLCAAMSVPAYADNLTASYSKVVDPVVTMLNGLLKPLLTIVIAVGSLYCVILGVKYAKAEEPQDREKAKQHLKNAVIGFFLIFILILALNVLKEPLIIWVNQYAKTTVIS